jgi:hypothetical protein
LGYWAAEVKALTVYLSSHDMTLELEPKKIVFRATNTRPTDRFNKKDAGVGNYAPADIDKPKLTKSALEFQRVTSVFESHSLENSYRGILP